MFVYVIIVYIYIKGASLYLSSSACPHGLFIVLFGQLYNRTREKFKQYKKVDMELTEAEAECATYISTLTVLSKIFS